jgi:hypothetical protein
MSRSALRLLVLPLLLWAGASCTMSGFRPPPESVRPAALPALQAVLPSPYSTDGARDPAPRAISAPPSSAEPARPAADVGAAGDGPSAARQAQATGDPPSSVRLVGAAPALTETLNNALQTLAKEQKENERLTESVRSLEQQLADKERVVGDLTERMHGNDARIQGLESSLQQWKLDVLGFRDEMRKTEEAEIEVLQKVLVLLEGFRKDKVAE